MTPAPTFDCAIVAMHDADGTWKCVTGEKLRIAGIQSADYTTAEPCRVRKPGYVCNNALAARQTAIARQLYLHKVIRCVPLDRSYSRIVVRCSYQGQDVACGLIRAGASSVWPKYWRRYRLPGCVR